MISYRRRFLAHREQARLLHLSEQDIPAIVVESHPMTPPSITRDITSPGQDLSRFTDPGSPTRGVLSSQSADLSLMADSPLSRATLQRNRRTSDVSMLSIDMMSPKTSLDVSSRESRYGDEDPDNILTSMQNSIWKEMMLAAEEEDIT